MNEQKKRHPWETYYAQMKIYQKEHGNIHVPMHYEINGLRLGKWLTEQRKKYKNGTIKSEQITKLEKLNVEWNGLVVRKAMRHDAWNRTFSLAKKYYEENGDLLIPSDYEKGGVMLGRWIITMRHIYYGKNKLRRLTATQIKKLNSIEMVWDVKESQWSANYQLAVTFYKQHGHLFVPQNYTINDVKLGIWIRTQRRAFHGQDNLVITKEQVEKLNAIHMSWNAIEDKWFVYFSLAKKFYNELGNLNIPYDFEMEGYKLGRWISVQRQAYNGREDVTLTSEQIEKLNSIGMLWSGDKGFQTSFFEQTIYYYCKRHFHDAVNKFTDLGFEIDIYIPSLKIGIEYDGSYWHRKKHNEDNKKDTLCSEAGIKLIRIREMPLHKTSSAINYILDEFKLSVFSNLLKQIFSEQFSVDLDIDIKRDMFAIVKDYKSTLSDPWFANFECAKKYYLEHGDLLVPRNYVCQNGVKLGQWIGNQRSAFKGTCGTSFLTEEKIAKLNDIGMIWYFHEHQWETTYAYAKAYYLENGHLLIPQNYTVDNLKLGIWIYRMRACLKKNDQKLTKERIDKLNEIGMVWQVRTQKEIVSV